MSRPSPARQRGFGLLSFVLVTAALAFSLVVGYAAVLTRQEANGLADKREAFLTQQLELLESYWRANAYAIDRTGLGNTTTAEELFKAARLTNQYGLALALSDVRVQASEDIAYRVAVLYLPAETDETNPPDLQRFRTTGEFQCANPGADCASRVMKVFSSLELQRELQRETQARLTQVAQKAQSYFKARMLQDPERNVSVNYFRKPLGACVVEPMDLDCVDTYQALMGTGVNGSNKLLMATNLALADEELYSAWGLPIEASNLQDSETLDTPFTMVFRALKPSGNFMRIIAVQQI